MSSPVIQHKHKSELFDSYRSSFDTLKDEEYLKAEEEIRSDHNAFYQLFLEFPEVHPDYTLHLEVFKKQFVKNYGKDQDQCKKLWETYWYEFVYEKQSEEWEMKSKMLRKQFALKALHDGKPLDKTKKKKHSSPKIQYETISSDDDELVVIKKDSISKKSSDAQPTLKTIPLTFSKNVSNEVGTSGILPLNYSLELLEDTCDSLGDIFGSVLKRVIKKIKDLSSTAEILVFLKNKDTIKLLKWASTKLKSMSYDAEGATKIKLSHCSQIALKLIVYGSEGTWNVKHSDLDINKVGDNKLSRLDIDKLAVATFNKDVPTTIAIIERSLKFYGVDSPTKEVVNSIFSKVSSCHLKMALDK